MGLETGQYIKDLVTNWPLATDKRREGDDHLRLIKQVLKNTFPNLDGPVTATPAQLNGLTDALGAALASIVNHLVPLRTVVGFAGLETQIPTGWALCNGQTHPTLGVLPDLRGKFIMGASSSVPSGSAGGASSVTTGVAGSHTHTVQGVALTSAQIPAHNHRLYTSDKNGSDIDPLSVANSAVAGAAGGTNGYLSANGSSTKLVEDTGSGQPHTHGMNSGGDHAHNVSIVPPFYALAYIIKVSEYSNG
jgi:microcystin-dependent protein